MRIAKGHGDKEFKIPGAHSTIISQGGGYQDYQRRPSYKSITTGMDNWQAARVVEVRAGYLSR